MFTIFSQKLCNTMIDLLCIVLRPARKYWLILRRLIAGDGLHNLGLCLLALDAFAWEGSLLCHTLCGMDLDFCSLIRKTAPPGSLLRHKSPGYWEPISTRIPTGSNSSKYVSANSKWKWKKKWLGLIKNPWILMSRTDKRMLLQCIFLHGCNDC